MGGSVGVARPRGIPTPDRPITPAAHGAIAPGSLAMGPLVPTVPGLIGPARAICDGSAAGLGPMNALTDRPPATRMVVPLRTRG